MLFTATCLFGLEGLLGSEIDELGYKRIQTIDGRVTFEAPPEAAAVCNITLRFAERLFINLGSFDAYSFDTLFEGTKALPWSDYIGKNDAFPVKGHSVRSKLFSIPDCQKIVKKAVVDSLAAKYGKHYFEETGIKYQIEFFILNDRASLMIDTSGEGLHKRGYRANAGIAPLRETLAAAMVKLSRPRDNVIICDPMCGSGTIAVEAALIATNTAPGINRSFAAESFPFFGEDMWRTARENARAAVTEPLTRIFGSDIDVQVLETAKENAAKAGMSHAVEFYCADVRDFRKPLENARGTLVFNPPYGERMGDLQTARFLYGEAGKRFAQEIPEWQMYIITSDKDFERYFGRRCDKKRVLYNGMIKCELFQFYKNRRNTPYK
ncbi:MAG: class I SAM-dependent RNA methyltransferase [Clostridia bacterium]|nr:class I SAM-dependent RNA methyltransferase [Clostridia bacterium]